MRTWKYLGFLFLILVFVSCDNGEQTDSDFTGVNAVLGDSDFTLCPCCGGYHIEIENESKSFRIESLPEDSNITLPSVDLEVEITYNIDRECGGLTYINIEKIKER